MEIQKINKSIKKGDRQIQCVEASLYPFFNYI